MPLPTKVEIAKETYRVYKTGIPFYDAARLIGVAHLFLGTASAEVEDRGLYWEVYGLKVARDPIQIEWVLEDGKAKAGDLRQKEDQLRKALKAGLPKEFEGLPSTAESYPALKEFDACLQRGPRGFDPLRDWRIVCSLKTPKLKEKVFSLSSHELVVSSVGFSFSASVKSGEYRTFILPVFRGRFVLSGFLIYQRNFYHAASGFVAEVLASLSILLDLANRRLPVADFVYTRVFGRNVFSSSGYLGLERLCIYWWEAIQRGKHDALNLLRNFRLFLQNTQSSNIDEQVQNLARWVADFIANPNVNALTKIEQLKARILASSQADSIRGGDAAKGLLGRSEQVKEVKVMLQPNLPEVPWQVSEALAWALGFDEKGWMNQFTRLENAPNFPQFIQQVERIISRGYYREQQEEGGQPNIQQALTKARDLANILRGMDSTLQDEKTFRAWKAIFLLDVLSRAQMKTEASPEQVGEEETQATEEG